MAMRLEQMLLVSRHSLLDVVALVARAVLEAEPPFKILSAPLGSGEAVFMHIFVATVAEEIRHGQQHVAMMR